MAAFEIDPARIAGIFITHAHADHYRTAGTLHARHGIPIYVDPSTEAALRHKGGNRFWHRVEETHPIPDSVGDLEVRAIDTSHRAEGRTVAYRFASAGRSVAVATDLGLFSESLRAGLAGVDAILLEANYDARTVRRKLADRRFAGDWQYLQWVQSDQGHLSNDQCGTALLEILRGPEAHVLLGHLSENHRSPEMDNNTWTAAAATVGQAFDRTRHHTPHLHRTYRAGRDPGRASVMVEVG